MLQKPIALKRAEQVLTNYVELIEPGVTLEQVLDTGYWVHIQNQKRLRLFDTFRFIAKDGSFDVEATIVMISPEKIRWHVLREWMAEAGKAETPKVELADPFVVKHAGREGGYRVIERTTSAIVHRGLDKAEADFKAAEMNAARKAA